MYKEPIKQPHEIVDEGILTGASRLTDEKVRRDVLQIKAALYESTPV